MPNSQASSSVLSLRIPGCRTEAPKEDKRDGLSEPNKLVGPRLGVGQPRIPLTFHSEKLFVQSQKLAVFFLLLASRFWCGRRATRLILRLVSAFIYPDRYRRDRGSYKT